MQQRRQKRAGLLLLITASAILIVLLVLTLRRGSTPSSQSAFDVSAEASAAINLRTPVSPATQLVTTSLFSSPADLWARELLDIYGSLLINRKPSPFIGGLVWWESSEQKQILSFVDGQLFLGSAPFTITEYKTIELYMPDATEPAALNQIGLISVVDNILTLRLDPLISSEPNVQWLISNGDPSTALAALAYWSQEEGYELEIAYEKEADGTVRVVIVSLRDNSLLTLTPVLPTETVIITPSITLIPSRTPQPTPTRTLDDYLGRLVAESISTLFDESIERPPTVVTEYISNHPWVGLLSWSESGPLIGGRSTAVRDAETSTIYILGEEEDELIKVLAATFDEANDATRLPELQVYFQGHRMAEILYWLVFTAAEQGGQLTVAYDDFGASQVFTIIQFTPFS